MKNIKENIKYFLNLRKCEKYKRYEIFPKYTKKLKNIEENIKGKQYETLNSKKKSFLMQ